MAARRVMLAVVGAAAMAVAASALPVPLQHDAPIELTEAGFRSWLAQVGVQVTGRESVPEWRTKLLTGVKRHAEGWLADGSALLRLFGSLSAPAAAAVDAQPLHTLLGSAQSRLRERMEEARAARAASGGGPDPNGFTPFGLEKYPYFAFLPPLVGKLIPDGPAVSWEAPCFSKSTARATRNGDGRSLTITLEVDGATSLLCMDSYLLATPDGMYPVSFFLHGSHSIQWKLAEDTQSDPAVAWDLRTNGVRLFRFIHDPVQTVVDLIDTVSLFIPAELEAGTPAAVRQRNAYFVQEYSGFRFAPRGAGDVEVDPSLIQSGDFFGIIRMDGLDPMLAWAMGSTTGHTTVAMRRGDELFVAESTAKDSYWPVDGVQVTPFDQWVATARKAGFNVVWAPLSEEKRAVFNETAAWEFVDDVVGLEYGYRNMLFGWLDTASGNFPCLPPDYKTCLDFEHLHLLFSAMDRLAPSLTDMLFKQALNKRAGTDGLNPTQVFYAAQQRGIAPETLHTVVEDDEWRYNTTRYGKPAVGRSMVCCVFVCHVWKAAGVFDDIGSDSVNCGELTNSDDYRLAIFNTDYDARPDVCKEADPDSPICQLMGDYKLRLNSYNSMKPYAHMSEKCPSLAPAYQRPAGC